MQTISKETRDRWLALAFACVLLLFLFVPGARFTAVAENYLFDQIVTRMQNSPLQNGVIVSLNADNTRATELLSKYEKLIKLLKTQKVKRIILTERLPRPADSETPEWVRSIGLDVPVYLPREDAYSTFATQSGVVHMAPDEDGVLRRIPLWQWQDGVMSPNLALAVSIGSRNAVPNQMESGFGDFILLSNYIPVTSFTEQEIFAPGFDTTSLAGKTIIVDHDTSSVRSANQLPSGQFVTNGGLTGMLLAALEQDEAITAPMWARMLEWLMPLLLTIAAVLLMPGKSRKDIAFFASTAILCALILEVLLLWIWRIKIGVATSIFIIAALALLNIWLASLGKRAAVNAFKRGMQFMAAGKLEQAFVEFRRCDASDTLSNALYKLSLAFEENAKPQRAEAVLNWMKRTQIIDNGRRRPATSKNGSPQQLGRYVIERKIGRGAMGAVYLARDPRINRAIALKVIPIEQEFDDEDLEEARLRFFGEAESAGRLTHPNIITVFDAGEEKHVAYIAMEYLEGKPLTEYTNPKNLLPPRQALELCARTADALHYAHQQQVIHRDIKPANLLYDASTDALKISDFGVARLTDSKRTKTGIVLGTPMYMSPEQLNAEKLTGLSDLFSLGVTLYELLTGTVPFKATNIAVLMTKITSEDPAPVSSLRSALNQEIDAVVAKAMAKKPADRFKNGAEMAAALRECARFMRA